jgi:hypothetical protein
MTPDSGLCVLHSGLTTQLLEHERRLGGVEVHVQKLYEAVNALSKRPSWLVTGVITFLSGGLCTTVTLLLTR